MKDKITIKDVRELGLEKISIKKLISDDKINRLSYFKMGGYHNQSIYTILATKAFDINKGYCYWALKNPNNSEKVNRFISTGSFNEEKMKEISDQQDYYVLITFTGSNACIGRKDTPLDIGTDESIDDFFLRIKHNIKKYIQNINSEVIKLRESGGKDNLKLVGLVKSSGIDASYPADKFPEIVDIEGNKSMAYIFEKLYYSTEKIKDISSIFEQVLMNDTKGKLEIKTSNQTNFFLKLAEKNIDNIIDTDNLQYIVARLHKAGTTTLKY